MKISKWPVNGSHLRLVVGCIFYLWPQRRYESALWLMDTALESLEILRESITSFFDDLFLSCGAFFGFCIGDFAVCGFGVASGCILPILHVGLCSL